MDRIQSLGIGGLIAVVVLVLVVVAIAGAIPATPSLMIALIGALAVARLT